MRFMRLVMRVDLLSLRPLWVSLPAAACVAAASFWWYSALRRMGGGPFGFSVPDSLIIIAVSLTLSIPLLALLFAGIFIGHVTRETLIPRARLGRGECPACRYPRGDSLAPCSECGYREGLPMPVAVSTRRALLVIVWVMLPAAVVGWSAAEAHSLLDERAFVRTVSADPEIRQWRSRKWPNRSSALMYTPEHGFWSTD